MSRWSRSDAPAMQGAPQEEAHPDSSGADPSEGALHSLPPAKVAHVANLEVAPGVLHVWSTLLHTDIWVCDTDVQARVFRAEGKPVYSPTEITHLGQLKVRDPAAFIEKLRTIHQTKQTFGAVIESLGQEETPIAAPVFQTRPDACYACGTTRRWRSSHGAVVCVQCHPPANAALVAAWDGEA